RERAGDERDLLQVDAGFRERQRANRDDPDVADDCGDRVLQAGFKAGARQKLALEPMLHRAGSQEAEQQHDGGGEYGSKRDRDPGDSGTPERALESTEHLKYRKSARTESEQHRENSEHGADDDREPQQGGNQGASEFDRLRVQAEVRRNGAARRLVG